MMIPNATTRSPWPHRWAWLLACATFPLIWVGGFVTTTDAGMAFRDWLTSDGHFMLVYPWFSAVGDKFVEHGHRLLGAAVGFLSIALVVVVWRTDSRRWIRKFSLVILAGVVLQGILGGMRVVLDERTLALVHGCTGPLFFALSVAMVVFTSRWWAETVPKESTARSRGVLRLAFICTGLAFAQLVVGAIVRHSPYLIGESASALFQAAVYAHLLFALLIVGNVLLLAWRCLRSRLQVAGGLCLALLVGLQLMLGGSSWVVKYGVPGWITSMVGETTFVNREADFLQNAIVTSHVAVGSLILVTALATSLRLARMLGVGVPRLSMKPTRLAGVAL
jgi:cytochrome c oxidase assembly protein subunit 15